MTLFLKLIYRLAMPMQRVGRKLSEWAWTRMLRKDPVAATLYFYSELRRLKPEIYAAPVETMSLPVNDSLRN